MNKMFIIHSIDNKFFQKKNRKEKIKLSAISQCPKIIQKISYDLNKFHNTNVVYHTKKRFKNISDFFFVLCKIIVYFIKDLENLNYFFRPHIKCLKYKEK